MTPPSISERLREVAGKWDDMVALDINEVVDTLRSLAGEIEELAENMRHGDQLDKSWASRLAAPEVKE